MVNHSDVWGAERKYDIFRIEALVDPDYITYNAEIIFTVASKSPESLLKDPPSHSLGPCSKAMPEDKEFYGVDSKPFHAREIIVSSTFHSLHILQSMLDMIGN